MGKFVMEEREQALQEGVPGYHDGWVLEECSLWIMKSLSWEQGRQVFLLP